MPYEIKIENDGAKVVTRYYGVLTTPELCAANKERFSDIEKVKKYKVMVADFTDVTEALLHDLDIPQYAQSFKHAASHNPNIIAVGIFPADFMFGLGRMFHAYHFEIPWKETVVRSREAAQAFLDAYDLHG